MSLLPGTVSIDPVTQVASGSGAALALYGAIEAEQVAAGAIIDPDHPPNDWGGTLKAWQDIVVPSNLNAREAWAREARAHAQLIAVITGGTVVSIPLLVGQLAPGVPAAPMTLIGTIG